MQAHYMNQQPMGSVKKGDPTVDLLQYNMLMQMQLNQQQCATPFGQNNGFYALPTQNTAPTPDPTFCAPDPMFCGNQNLNDLCNLNQAALTQLLQMQAMCNQTPNLLNNNLQQQTPLTPTGTCFPLPTNQPLLTQQPAPVFPQPNTATPFLTVPTPTPQPLLFNTQPQTIDIDQFDGDYLIENKDFVRIVKGIVTFWIAQDAKKSQVKIVEGRLTVHKLSNKTTVMLQATFFSQEYRFFWTGKGADYIEWTHYEDLGKRAPIRWTRIPTQSSTKIGHSGHYMFTKHRHKARSDDSRENSTNIHTSHSGHSSGHSSQTSDRCDSEERIMHVPSPKQTKKKQQQKQQQQAQTQTAKPAPTTPTTSKRKAKKQKQNAQKQDHNCKQKMLAQVGWDVIDRYYDIIIDPEKALFLKNTTEEERVTEEIIEKLHCVCDDVKPGLRGPLVFSIRAKKQKPELENTIKFLETMEEIATFKRLSLIFNSKTKTINGKTVRRKQKKTICIYVEVETKEQVDAVLELYAKEWKKIIGFCKITNEKKEIVEQQKKPQTEEEEKKEETEV